MSRTDATIPLPRAAGGRSPLLSSLRSNALVPVAVGAVLLFGRFVATRAVIGAYNLDITMLVGIAIIMAVSLQLINGYSGQFSLGHAGFMAIGAYFSAYPSKELSRGMSDPLAVLGFYAALGAAVGVAGLLLTALFLAARSSGRLHPLLPGLLMLLILLWIIADVAIASRRPGPAPSYLVVSKVIELLRGLFTAILRAGVRAGGASDRIPMSLRQPFCFVALLCGGGLCAAAAGLVVGLPTLRLRGDYLAIATLGFAEIIRVAITNATPMGGALGLGGIPNYTDFSWLYCLVVVTVLVIWRIAYSARGRAVQAVREDEVAAAAVGIDTTTQKVFTFVIGAFFAGLGGVLYAHYTGFITPNDFGLLRSIEFVVMVTLGGLASVSGALLAAVVLTILPELLRNLSDVAWWLPAFLRTWLHDLVEWRMVIYSLALVLMMLLRPQGLLGGRELWPLRRGRRRKPPAAGAAEPRAAAV